MQTILGNFYSSAVIDCREECEEIFRYLFSFLLSIKNNCMLDDKEKESRFREISCLLPENGRILFLCWGFCFKHETKQFYNKYIKPMHVEVDEDGEVFLRLGTK